MNDFERDFRAARERGLPEDRRDRFHDYWVRYSGDLELDTIVQLAMLNTTEGTPAPLERPETVSLSRTPPGGLDQPGLALFSSVIGQVKGESEGLGFYAALAAETGDRAVLEFSDVPISREDIERYDNTQGVDQDAIEQDRAARRLMDRETIGYADAAVLAGLDQELARTAADDGSSELPWQDLTPLDTPARPWSDDDWQRDSRRARTAGLQLDRTVWEGHAEEGRDLPSEYFAQQREQRLTRLRTQREQHLSQAKVAEARRREAAINSVLDRQAESRLAGRG